MYSRTALNRVYFLIPISSGSGQQQQRDSRSAPRRRRVASELLLSAESRRTAASLQGDLPSATHRDPRHTREILLSRTSLQAIITLLPTTNTI